MGTTALRVEEGTRGALTDFVAELHKRKAGACAIASADSSCGARVKREQIRKQASIFSLCV
eukprot:2168663-Rhodomonas_salina.2